MTPQQLDAQSPVKVNRWIDIDSEESKQIDDNRQFTKHVLNMGLESLPDSPAFLYTDTDGRIWGFNPKNPEAPHYPFHLETERGELVGLRMARKAAN